MENNEKENQAKKWQRRKDFKSQFRFNKIRKPKTGQAVTAKQKRPKRMREPKEKWETLWIILLIWYDKCNIRYPSILIEIKPCRMIPCGAEIQIDSIRGALQMKQHQSCHVGLMRLAHRSVVFWWAHNTSIPLSRLASYFFKHILPPNVRTAWQSEPLLFTNTVDPFWISLECLLFQNVILFNLILTHPSKPFTQK